MKDKIFAISVEYLQANWREMLSKFLRGAAVFTILYFVIKLLIEKFKKQMTSKALIQDTYIDKHTNLIWSILFVILMIFNALVVLNIIGLDTAIVIWWISLSIWFAMETTIANMVSWIFILTNKKFKIWDIVEFAGKVKAKGKIEEINIRYIVLKGFDRKKMVIPNRLAARTPIQTYKSEPIIKWEFIYRVPRKVPLDLIKNIYRDVLSKTKGILYPEHSALVIESFWRHGVHLKCFFFCNPAKWLPVWVARRIKSAFTKELKKHNIHVPHKYLTLSSE